MFLKRGSIGAMALLSLALGCTEPGRSLIPVDVSASGLTSLSKVRVVVVEGATKLKESAPETWTPGSTLHLGVRLPKEVSGTVSVVACGFDAGGAVVDASSVAVPSSVPVVPGKQSSLVMVTLSPGVAPSVCSTGAGGGGMGGGGTSGSTGSAGYSGNGGGGAGGTTGGSGTTGTAGVAGTTGGAGTTGAAGTTGVAGMGGRGGTGGSGGSGGTGGVRVLAWGGATAVAANPAINERFPAVAMDSLGNAVMVYQQASGIRATRFNASTGLWSTPVPIDDRAGQAGSPVIAVDKNGNYTAVWGQQSGSSATFPGIWQSTSTDGEHWTGPASITTTSAWQPRLSMNADGAAVVAWTENNTGSTWQASASTRPSTGGAWTAPQVLRTGDDNGTRDPAVSISATGEAFVGWEQGEGGTADWTSIWMRQHTSAGWGAAMLMETYDTQGCYSISLATNRTGAAIVTWIQVSTGGSGTTLSLLARRYLPASGFGPVAKVAEGTDIDWEKPPALTLDDAGVATVAWGFLTQGHFNVYLSKASPSEAWPAPMAMETDNEAAIVSGDSEASAPRPVLGMDTAGNTTLIWLKRKGTRFDLWTRRLPAGGAWTPEMLLESRDTDSVSWPVLSVGTNGTAIAAWHYWNEGDIWVNLFK